MQGLFHRFFPFADEHPSDDRLARLSCDDLSFVHRWAARRHLKQCWHCRLRLQDLEGRRSRRVFDLYRNRSRRALPEFPEHAFSRRLQTQIHAFSTASPTERSHPGLFFPLVSSRRAALAVCAVFCISIALSVVSWRRQHMVHVSSSGLLIQAEHWDTANLSRNPSVILQTVRITMKRNRTEDTISRAIYRDPQFKRVPRNVELSPVEEQIKDKLAEAGMDWNEPLSASTYRHWYDLQHVRNAKVSRAGAHLLRLTTTVPDGAIAEQSLTVREDDFHPVGRTIAMRNSATVEIAEVDFKVLPWSSVAKDAFESPTIAGENALSLSRVGPITLPRQTEVLNEMQLDAAELGTRLILNQLHADTGEELRIERHPEGIVLRGIVGSEERKHELETKLQFVAHTSVKIQSIEEINAKPMSDGTVQTVAVGIMPEQLSSLQVYLKAKGKSVSDINRLTQRLYHDALTISQESKAIRDLQTRFGDESQRTLMMSATLSELIYSHHERLENALRNERALLSEIHASSPSLNAATKNAGTLSEAADTNFSLTQTLTKAQQTDGRDTDMILDEMASVLIRLSVAAQNPYENVPRTQALDGTR